MIEDKSAEISQCAENIRATIAYFGLPQMTFLTTQVDRVTATIPDGFDAAMKEMVRTGAFYTWDYGIEDHLISEVPTAEKGWRDRFARASTQIVQHKTGVLEIDQDFYNPDRGAGPGLFHLFEVLANKLGRKKTNPFRIAKVLKKRFEVA